VSFSEPNGTYGYTIENMTSVGGWRQYRANVTSGSAIVSGSDVVYAVTYSELFLLNVTGTPAGDGATSPAAGWHDANSVVSLDALPANGFVFSKWAGTGQGAYSGTNDPDNLTLVDSVNETATFVVATYVVTFLEVNLNLGTSWSVTLDGKVNSTTGAVTTFTLPNGTYQYSISEPSGYTLTPSTGFIMVDGHAMTVNVPFQVVQSPTGILSSTVMGVPLYIFIILIVVVVVVVLLLLIASRRRNRNRTTPAALKGGAAPIATRPGPAPIPPASPKTPDWSEEGGEIQSATVQNALPVASGPAPDLNKAWAITITTDGVEVAEMGKGPPTASGQAGNPAATSPVSPVDVYNILKTLEKGPRSVAELEWRVELSGTDRITTLLGILTSAELVKPEKSSSGVDQYALTPKGTTVMRQKAGTDVAEAPPADTSPRPSTVQPAAGHALGESRQTTDEASPFGTELKPEDVNPQLKGQELLSKEALQPLEINVQANRGADSRESTAPVDADERAQALMNKAKQARQKKKGKFGVEQEKRPSGDQEQKQ
jgi:DNA-binding PadR family transcriptional regulator